LWSKVWNDQEREAYIQNVSGHFKGVKSPEVKARQLSVWAAVDQDLSDRIAAAIGHPPVAPLKVKPASEAVKYEYHAN
jgi:catalase